MREIENILLYSAILCRMGSTGLGSIMLCGYQVKIESRDTHDRMYKAMQYNAKWVSGENTDEIYAG